MTVTEYREKHPNCEYCQHRGFTTYICSATKKRMSKMVAKKCPCYLAATWPSDKKENDKN